MWCEQAPKFKAKQMLRHPWAWGVQQSLGKSCDVQWNSRSGPAPAWLQRLQGKLKKLVKKCFQQNCTENIIVRGGKGTLQTQLKMIILQISAAFNLSKKIPVSMKPAVEENSACFNLQSKRREPLGPHTRAAQHRVWEICSPVHFPCDMPKSPRRQLNSHSTARHSVCVDTCLAAPAWHISRAPGTILSSTNFRNKKNSVVHGRDTFRECFDKFLWKQNDYVNADQPAGTTNSFFPLQPLSSLSSGSSRTRKQTGSSGGSRVLGFAVILKHCVKLQLLPACPSGNSGEEDAVGVPLCAVQGWDTPDLALTAHLLMTKGRVLSLGSLLQWLGGVSLLPRQLCLLLSTAHTRRSFSSAQLKSSNGLGLYCCCTCSPQMVFFVKLPGTKVDLCWVLPNSVAWQRRGCHCSLCPGPTQRDLKVHAAYWKSMRLQGPFAPGFQSLL